MSRSVPDAVRDAQLGELRRFRRAVYEGLPGWRDTLFEMMDAVLASPQRLVSLPWLSLEAPVRRGHGSVYRALERGRVDPAGLARALTGLLTGFAATDFTTSRAAGPRAADAAQRPWVFALDCSHWPRPDAATSPERTFNYDASKDRFRDHRSPVTAGWWFQWVAATTWGHSSWTLPVDVARISPGENYQIVAVAQIRALLQRLPAGMPGVPIVCLDGDYAIGWLGRQLAGEPVQLLGRLRSDAMLFTDPPPRPPGTRGRTRVHGPIMKLADPATWPTPDQTLHIPAHPEQGRAHPLTIQAWHRLHTRHSRKLPEPHPGSGKARDILHGTVIRIQSAKPGEKPIWLLWTGPDGSFDLDTAWRAYLHRFDIEHLFRFCKQHLGWTTPRIRTPEQATRWTWLIATAYAHLTVARTLITDHRLPWEHPDHITPLRVKRGFPGLLPTLGTPAKPPQKTTPGPGRPPGRTSGPAPRHPVVRKRPKKPKTKTPNTTRRPTPTTTPKPG